VVLGYENIRRRDDGGVSGRHETPPPLLAELTGCKRNLAAHVALYLQNHDLGPLSRSSMSELRDFPRADRRRVFIR
jgi:hypothetical protein